MHEAINLAEKFGKIAEHWRPRVVAELNDYQFKLVKIEGDFVWHSHADTDEAFIVIEGELRIDFRDGAVTSDRAKCTSSGEVSSTSPMPSARFT